MIARVFVSRALILLAVVAVALGGSASEVVIAQKRARDLGIPFDGEPGPLNAITDVSGVEVGHVTIIEGEGRLIVGKGPIRTGVTAVLPRGKRFAPVYAGWSTLNGAGEMTGTAWIDESGFLEGPIMLTNTHSVGVVRDAVLRWMRDDGVHEAGDPVFLTLPVVAETDDGTLNDISGFHVTQDHAVQALRSASRGTVSEGSVGGGTGMICHDFKGGIGTSSRVVHGYTVGVLVQCNYGRRTDLRIAGVPVGREISGGMPEYRGSRPSEGEQGSIIVIVATDAPLLPYQLKRVARRVSQGLGRMGGAASNGSGDIFLAFSTANEQAWNRDEQVEASALPNDWLSPIFRATVDATEEAIVNALVAGRDMDGVNGTRIYGLPHDEVRTILGKYGRLER